ncbi:MAG TPA: hypothetical protein VJJ80_00375, partial [Patescibacteria group bacterium]|nr:hypothetical protein [Patescibacteria group bacterium]
KPPADGTTGAASSESKTFDINTSQSNQIQSQVDAGSLAWYLDPILVAKDQVPPTFSINKDDQFSLKSKSFTEGIAIVEVIHGTKIYQIKLIQPVKKGENGIWVCESVSAA